MTPISLHRQLIPYGDDAWRTLRPEWVRLSTQLDRPSAFTSAEWVDTWWDVFADRYRPLGVVWRDASGRAVGCALLPFEQVQLGPFPVRRAYLNASSHVGALCEHNDVLVEPEHRGAVLQDLTEIVLDSGVDELALVGTSAETARVLSRQWPEDAWSGYGSQAHYVCLGQVRAQEGEYLAGRSSNTRSQIRRSLRLYERELGPLEVTVARPSEAVDWFAEMIDLHEVAWRARGEEGVFGPDATRFHSRLVERCSTPGSGSLTTTLLRVRFGSVTVALLYLLERAGHVSFYQSGLVYDADARLKPGLVAHTLAIRHYLRAGASEYDFLGGEPNGVRYKRSLSTHCRVLAWRELPVSTARVKLIGGLRGLRRRLYGWGRVALMALGGGAV